MTSRSATGEIAAAVEALRAGGLVAYPTDTLYGLGADALNEAAVERVFEAKGRPQGMPLPLLISDAEQLPMVAASVPDAALTLAGAFWPGGLTLVLPVSDAVPPLVTARGWKVAVRLPDHPVPRALAEGLGRPITGTSANRSGGPEPRTAAGVREALGEAVDVGAGHGAVAGGALVDGAGRDDGAAAHPAAGGGVAGGDRAGAGGGGRVGGGRVMVKAVGSGHPHPNLPPLAGEGAWRGA